MLFTSLDYFIFLPIVFCLYWWVCKNHYQQNTLLLAASYFFYGCWDYRYLPLLMFSTFLDYFTGLRIGDATNPGSKRGWLWLSIAVNVGFLGFFKYYNFFVGAVHKGWTLSWIILPVGISFYTFHGLSYILDIYYERIKPHRRFVDYAVFVSFFPLLVAGPIERATHLLPQITVPRRFDYTSAVEGLRRILWGLFKKIVIADTIAGYIELPFLSPSQYSGSTLVVSAILFSIQIYADFSGYTDIALGSARLLGIDLIRNFNYPYFSTSLGNFWRRWHISLSTWFNDYLFTPLTVQWRYRGIHGVALAIICTFLVSGLWHGAAFTFILWGFLHGVGLTYELYTKKLRKRLFKRWPVGAVNIVGGIATFSYVTFTLIFFRAKSFYTSLAFLKGIFSPRRLPAPLKPVPPDLLAWLTVFVFLECAGRKNVFPLEHVPLAWPRAVKWALYFVFLFVILLYAGQDQQFIYFQF
jgi:D-alanyl-lipoteichoic acid acyltransferase DltB (MBOAT superfamily)